MKFAQSIRKIFKGMIGFMAGAGMLTLLLAAIGNKKDEICKGIQIVMDNENEFYFLNEKDVRQIIEEILQGKPEGRPVESFRLHEMEKVLEKSPWIRNAEFYFDNHHILHVVIKEKKPVARIFTTERRSFYLDEQLGILPLSVKRAVKVPVVTGFPDKKIRGRSDSALLRQVKELALFIQKSSFWNAQVAQLHITPTKEFEMIPLVGNHTVKLGQAEELEKKFYKLLVFYKEVLTKTGFNYYGTIDLRFKGQVVANRKAEVVNIDTVTLKKRVEILLSGSTIQDVEKRQEIEEPGKTKQKSVNSKRNHETVVINNAPKLSAETENSGPKGKTENTNQTKMINKKAKEGIETARQEKLKNKADKKPKAVMPSMPIVENAEEYY
ncbi:MAG: cell division protein FtsQ/DivIB [Chitinophagaceae bacterium]|nr:cell division protein FtsQ/DivIB [Chitinophagaceae bacterium]